MRAAKGSSSKARAPDNIAPNELPGRAFLASAGLGFVLGAVVWRGPIYSLEIAQVAAGRVVLPPQHPVYAHHTSVISPFLVQIPAVLLRLGVPEFVLCVVMSGLVAALAFSAVSVCAWAFSRDRIFALAAPVLFLALQFSGHKYPLFFPAGEHDTGIAGFFAALLAVGLASLGPSRAAALSLGLLPAIHPTLALAIWLGCATALPFSRPTERRAWFARWPWLSAGLGMLVVGWVLRAILARPPAEFLPASDATISEMIFSVMVYFDFHRYPIGLWVQPWRMLPFFEIDLYWIVFLTGLVWIGKSGSSATFLIKASLAWTGVATLFILMDEAWPDLLPLPVKALMITRWLNLNEPLFVLGVLGSLVRLIHERGRAVAAAVLTLVLAALAFGIVSRPAPLNGDLMGVANSLSWRASGAVFPIVGLVVLILLALDRRSWAVAPRRTLRYVADMALVLAALVTLGRAVHRHGLTSWSPNGILQTERNRAVFGAARLGSGLLVIPPWTAPWAQLQTGRGILPDTELVDVLPYVPRAAPAFEQILNDVYGVSLFSSDGWGQYALVQDRWLGRPTDDWVRIRRAYGATEVLVPIAWKLQLPEEARSPDMALYRIPED